MLLSTRSEIVDNGKALYDIKWDGWRILLHKKGNRIEAYTRHENVVINKFPELQQAVHQI
ncbi:hypothetical protein [Bacillus sp. V59.32b]|uniref:ATP-dependent DNA ligase n=1 Tax=Bacillus sp. V59.32b TaxID=1758642 RepID=UPI000E3BC610|nr:hypothetical protein D0463_11920 [Bacillus sp. V59.32b]